eukprot:scpid107194/ scgid15992/ 
MLRHSSVIYRNVATVKHVTVLHCLTVDSFGVSRVRCESQFCCKTGLFYLGVAWGLLVAVSGQRADILQCRPLTYTAASPDLYKTCTAVRGFHFLTGLSAHAVLGSAPCV